MLSIKNPAKGIVAHGISACAGCGLELAARHIIEIMGRNTSIVIPPGCAALFSGFGNTTAVTIPGFQGNLENTAAYAAGIKAGFEIQGRDDINVLGLAGDGGTVDIGLQALSGALERGDKIVYVCYDNEAYMNTGIQSSSSTPVNAWTTTTPGGKSSRRKDLMQIVLSHRIPYAATASVAYIDDLRKKIQKAKDSGGPAFVHVHAPCPTGWGYNPAKTVELAKLAVASKCWILYEAVNGRDITITRKIKEAVSPKGYFDLQKRFAQLTEDDIEAAAAEAAQDYWYIEQLASLKEACGETI